MVRLDHILRAWWQVPLKQAQKRIREGGVTVDGAACTEPKWNVVPGVEEVRVAQTAEAEGSSSAAAGGSEPVPCEAHIFCVMNKPAGYVSQRHPSEPSVYDLIPHALARPDLSAFGRLDRDTTGMLLFGTDGGVQSLLLFPTSRVWKTYTAEIAEGVCALLGDASEQFERGIVLDDGLVCAPAQLSILSATAVRVRLHEGHFHQVKRMLQHGAAQPRSLVPRVARQLAAHVPTAQRCARATQWAAPSPRSIATPLVQFRMTSSRPERCGRSRQANAAASSRCCRPTGGAHANWLGATCPRGLWRQQKE
uniref:Pseudouridine synthase RsuA/RluA-like domain-containing protein n=1 Tax=Calcidiscus leptoporus TaxID=127549 RepID=A0A7S0J9L7_9EUKA|mmetsp:Transcript_46681/g.108468  ORF Transcript_46681/g.108468 Transcript_46681/m.108468 type:complete len:308 (+) Transcript_46681:77-1000(+)